MSKNMNRRLFYMFLIRLTSDTEQPASDIQIRDFIKHIFIEIIEEGRKNTEGKAKVVAAGWGRILEYRTYHLAARLMFWRNVLGKTSPFGGCVLVFIHSFKASFPPSSRYYIHPFFKSSWWKTASAAMNWINSIPQAAATTFAFSSVFILLLWKQQGIDGMEALKKWMIRRSGNKVCRMLTHVRQPISYTTNAIYNLFYTKQKIFLRSTLTLRSSISRFQDFHAALHFCSTVVSHTEKSA